LKGEFVYRKNQAKAICCHAGIAPFAHHSGTKTYTRSRVSHWADKRLKMLLHLAPLQPLEALGSFRSTI